MGAGMTGRRAFRVSSWLWPLVGIVLLTAWVFGAAFAFLYLLRVLPDGMTVATIGLLSWQFVIVLVAVPVLAIVMIGGLKMLSYAVTIRELLRDLPEQVQTLGQLSQVATTIGDQIERAKGAMIEAAGTFDQAMSQLADFQSRMAQTSNASSLLNGPNSGVAAQGTQSAAQPTQKELVDELIRHLDHAKQIFDSAAKKYETEKGTSVERVRGWILDSSVAELRAAGAITPMQAAYIGLALDVDRKTRRSGRSNLDPADLTALDAIEPRERERR